MFICPEPGMWYQIYNILEKAWEDKGAKGTPPPIPLILAGWNISDDYQKYNRWKDTIIWAQENNFIHLFPKILEKDSYYLDEIPERDWPINNSKDCDFDPKFKPTKEQVNETMDRLLDKWSQIISPPLNEITIPLKLTGPKKRRLVILAEPEEEPPWGSWNAITQNSRSFTRFRKAINDFIKPLEIDHIDFEFRPKE